MILLSADADCGKYIDQSITSDCGAVQHHLLGALGPIFWVSMVVYFGVTGLILFAAFKYRRRADDEEPRQVHGNSRLELGWTLVPFVILLGLFALTTYEMHYVKTTPASAMKMCVVGQRFVWVFHYSGVCPPPGKVDKSDVVVTSGVSPHIQPMVIPVGKPISVDLTADDVIHSFYVPTLAGQVNNVPGQLNHMWLQADQVGIYYGQCTELCGAGHANMLLEIKAVSQRDYDAWYQKAKANK
ncbi:MAG: cytochrome c oxidase subunit II [Candidatus Dormibacteria bacterium]